MFSGGIERDQRCKVGEGFTIEGTTAVFYKKNFRKISQCS